MSEPNLADMPPRELWRLWRQCVDAADTLIDRGELEAALPSIRSAAKIAEHFGQINALWTTARLALNLSDWGTSARLWALAERVQAPDGPPEWDGDPLPKGTLVVTERNNPHVAQGIRLGHLIGLAAARVQHCVVFAEPRLVPLFRRTFPSVDVRETGANGGEAIAGATRLAGYHTLVQHLAPDSTSVRAGYSPLKADQALVGEMRRRYGGGPLVGISWHSTNPEKDLPSLADWGVFLASLNATFVSLQYGDVAQDVSRLRAASGKTVIHDETVDSLVDLDGYAAQVAAMDAVVTISNTCAHMAGALNVPTTVMVEEIRKTRLEWPLAGETTPWYPSVTLVRKGERSWRLVFEDVQHRMGFRA